MRLVLSPLAVTGKRLDSTRSNERYNRSYWKFVKFLFLRLKVMRFYLDISDTSYVSIFGNYFEMIIGIFEFNRYD